MGKCSKRVGLYAADQDETQMQVADADMHSKQSEHDIVSPVRSRVCMLESAKGDGVEKPKQPMLSLLRARGDEPMSSSLRI